MGISDILINDFEKILELIPQKPPIVMIDKLLYSDTKSARTSLTINKDNIFCEYGYFTEPGIIENMAQTASVKVGYEAKINKQKVPAGFIGEIKKLKIFLLPKINEVLITTITIEYEILNALIINAEIYGDKRKIAQCKMKIFLERE